MKIQKSFKNDKSNLYIIPTPIGNLEDMTLRAINIIKNDIDILLCEDTRNTRKILNKYEIDVKVASYHEFNKEKVTKKFIEQMESGTNFGLVSDAGMPGISDPGFDLIKEATEKNVNVVVIPGASAFVVALVRSNFPNDRFTYIGFLSAAKNKRKSEVDELLKSKTTTIFYDTPHKIITTLNFFKELDPKRHIFIGREMTKLNEEYITGLPHELIFHFEEKKPRGEFVVVVYPKISDVIDENLSIEERVEQMINGGESQKDAIKKVAKERKIKKNEVYKLFIEE